MYLKFTNSLDLPVIGKLLSPTTAEHEFDHDSENVYEWMYIDLPGIGFSLNASREHGWANLDDDLLDFNNGIDSEELRKLVTPGPIYVMGWDRVKDVYVDQLPESLAYDIANCLSVEVLVYAGRMNVDRPDLEPIAVVRPGLRWVEAKHPPG